MAAPVLYEGRVYVGSGQDAERGEGAARLVCIDPTKTGDISWELAVDAAGKLLPQRRTLAVDFEKGEKAVPNPNSGLVWEYTTSDRNGDGKIEFEEQFHRTQASVTIKDGLLISVDFSGLVHCLDAKTGQIHWTYDLMASVYAPPLIVDDKFYIGDEDGDLAVFRLSANPPHAPIFESNFVSGIYTAPIFSDGVLYVASRNWLFAIAKEADANDDTLSREGNWPQWRGPLRDNRSRDVGLLQEWPADGPPRAWRVDGIGNGIASVSIAGGRVYTLGYHEWGEYVTALSEKNAERLWQTRLGTGNTNELAYALAEPAVADRGWPKTLCRDCRWRLRLPVNGDGTGAMACQLYSGVCRSKTAMGVLRSPSGRWPVSCVRTWGREGVGGGTRQSKRQDCLANDSAGSGAGGLWHHYSG